MANTCKTVALSSISDVPHPSPPLGSPPLEETTPNRPAYRSDTPGNHWHKKLLGTRPPLLKPCLIVILQFLHIVVGSWSTTASAQEAASKDLSSAESTLGAETYLLRYKLEPGDELVYHVKHLASVDTRVRGNRERSNSRSISYKLWRVQPPTEKGEFVFQHVVLNVDMWEKSTGRTELRYNSEDDASPPVKYENVATTIGKPLSTVTMKENGQIVHREDLVSQIDFGIGGLVVPLPEKPIKVGTKWNVPAAIPIRLKDGRIKRISTRRHYQLEKVETGVATISVDTQVLTPDVDARARSQLLQRLSHGEIKFDIDAGRIISKAMNWDESLVGFNGPESSMKYHAEFTERLEPRYERIAERN